MTKKQELLIKILMIVSVLIAAGGTYIFTLDKRLRLHGNPAAFPRTFEGISFLHEPHLHYSSTYSTSCLLFDGRYMHFSHTLTSWVTRKPASGYWCEYDIANNLWRGSGHKITVWDKVY